MVAGRPGRDLVGAGWKRSKSGRQPPSPSAFARAQREALAGQMQRAIAWPTAAQWRGCGRRIHTPSRNVTSAAGRPASSRSMRPLASRTGVGQLKPGLGQVLHEAEEERQVGRCHALLVEGEEEGPFSVCTR